VVAVVEHPQTVLVRVVPGVRVPLVLEVVAAVQELQVVREVRVVLASALRHGGEI
jgi:hypothetical protein